MRTSRVLVAALAVVALSAGACGGDDDLAAPPTTSRPAPTTTSTTTSQDNRLSMHDNRFDPARFVILSLGGGLTQGFELVNKGLLLHNFSIEGTKIDNDINAGASEVVSSQPLAPGTYKMFCKIHRSGGMEGIFVVS